MKVVLLFLLLGLARAVDDEPEDEYQNELECDLDVECPKCHALYKVKAKFSPGQLDQQWLWDCKKIGYWKEEEEDCRWYNEINDVGGFMAFRCPKDSYMSGVWSEYIAENGNADRVWSIKCCTKPGLCIRDCFLTDYLSDSDGDFYHSAYGNDYFVGLFSHFDQPMFTAAGRAKWKVEQCRIVKCSLQHYLSRYGYEYYKK